MDEEKPEITGYKKYSVILVNTFGSNAIINKKIADQGYAIQTDSFEIVDFEKLITKNDVINEQSDSNDEQSKGGADEENVEEIIRDNSSDESDTWDFQTRDAEKFLKEILKVTYYKMSILFIHYTLIKLLTYAYYCNKYCKHVSI